jgi:hypothetical protein
MCGYTKRVELCHGLFGQVATLTDQPLVVPFDEHGGGGRSAAASSYSGDGGIMKKLAVKKGKKSDVTPFSNARKAVIDEMTARTPVVKVPSRLRLTK